MELSDENFSKHLHGVNGLNNICRKCASKIHKEYYEANKERIKEKARRYYYENKDEINIKAKKYREAHKDEISAHRKEYASTDEYKEKRRDYKKKYYELKKNDPVYMFKERVRHTIWMSFHRKGYSKKDGTQELVGITFEELYQHLMKTFVENYGVEWDGIEQVHIDHIIPLARASTEEEVAKLCHWSNLQLLKSRDNLVKKDK